MISRSFRKYIIFMVTILGGAVWSAGALTASIDPDIVWRRNLFSRDRSFGLSEEGASSENGSGALKVPGDFSRRPPPGIDIRGIVYSVDDKMALLHVQGESSEKLVREGEFVGGRRLVRIGRRFIVLEGPGGSIIERWLPGEKHSTVIEEETQVNDRL
jgi:hypothetical protein